MTTRITTADLHTNVLDHEKRIGSLEQSTVRHEERIGELRKDVDEVCKLSDDLQKVVIKSATAISVGTWIVAGFGISVIALIWSLITGQASLNFK